ncbi:peptidase U32 family protein [Breznakia pachnodae]|uniref:Protease n=1 Tax=Breznakia pachnodae TaxID=265178 RepID=A0ABU0DYY1_9FIRM|nr:U32 family peptidase [Breznakia pachnodae]MDQ0359845.1 putative protease [Breznakia pachnodae]
MINLITSPYQLEDITKLKAVGITSVIVGTEAFSVRSPSAFNNEQLQECRTLCTSNHMQMYVSVNRFFMEDDLIALREHLQYLKELDVDGIYFTDMGVFYEAKQLGLESKLIYNPDTILTNSADIQAYLDLGIHMCTISKEITLEDMLKIGNRVNGELEIIIHGRLPMMDSKRMLLSNYMEFIKKEYDVKNNYQLYLMEENREEHMPIVEDKDGTHVFTGFTLASFEEVEDMINAGICNLRIESLFYTIDEVCKITEDYKRVMESPREGRLLYKEYEKEYPSQNITKGFMYKKTGAKK